jgi:hypothetical protein
MWIKIYCTVLYCLPYCLDVYTSATMLYKKTAHGCVNIPKKLPKQKEECMDN